MLPIEDLVHEWAARIPSGVINFTNDDFVVLESVLIDRGYPLTFVLEYVNEIRMVVESEASREAKKQGLVSIGWGKWADPSNLKKAVAKTVDGKLVPVRGDEEETDQDGSQDEPQATAKPRQSAPDVEDRAAQGDVAAQLKVQADKKKKQDMIDKAEKLGIDAKDLKAIQKKGVVDSKVDLLINRGVDPDVAKTAPQEIVDAALSGDLTKMRSVVEKYGLRIGTSGGLRTSQTDVFRDRKLFGSNAFEKALANVFANSGALETPFDKSQLDPSSVYSNLEGDLTPDVKLNEAGDPVSIGVGPFVSSEINLKEYLQRHPDTDDDTIQAIKTHNGFFSAFSTLYKDGSFRGTVIRRGNSEKVTKGAIDTISKLDISAERKELMSAYLTELSEVPGEDDDAISEIVSKILREIDRKPDGLTEGRAQICELLEIIVSTRRNDFTVIPPRGAAGGDVYGIRLGQSIPEITTVDMDDDELLDLLKKYPSELELSSVKFGKGGSAGGSFIVSVTTYDTLEQREKMENFVSSDPGSSFNELWYGDKEKGISQFKEFLKENYNDIQNAFIKEFGTDDVESVLKYAATGKKPPRVKRGESYPPPPKNTPLWAEGGECASRALEWETMGQMAHVSAALHNFWKKETKLSLAKYTKTKGRTFSNDVDVEAQTYKNYRKSDCAPDAAFSWHQRPA